MKTSELIGPALDWVVATITKAGIVSLNGTYIINTEGKRYSPSTDWAQGGPIIERERIATVYRAGEYWLSYTFDGAEFEGIGPTPLIAAMRCFVSSKLGGEVEIPEELK
jgi:hypothetical protein